MDNEGGGGVNPKAYPLAGVDCTAKILSVVNQAQNYSLLKLGINETVKALNKNAAQVVVLAADAQPLDILLHIPLLCESKAVVYVFVPFKAALGRAGGLNRDVVACAIVSQEDSNLQSQVDDLIRLIEQNFI